MTSSTHLVIGVGEVGTAIRQNLSEHYKSVESIDKDQTTVGTFDFIHICFPYSDTFTLAVMQYQLKYEATNGITIIHSTVPVGTTERLNAVHSPVRGVHPHLYEGVKLCTKFFGGKNIHKVNMAMEVFFPICPVHRVTDSNTSEALKLWCTTQYGWNIILEKAIHNYCVMNNLNFDEVYTLSNITYNEDAIKLNMPHVRRPVLKHMDGPIGGHCVMPNARILSEDSSLANMLLFLNEQLTGND